MLDDEGIAAVPPSGGRVRADLTPGLLLEDRYRLRKLLGRGGFCAVWLAHDEQLQMDVAVKLLAAFLTEDTEAVEDLKLETKNSLRLTHPNIVRIYDFFQADDIAGIVMEYVDGGTLSGIKAQRHPRCFDPGELASWILDLCDALDYAHRRVGVVHRDLKPGNLMVDGHGGLKVADFGIARTINDTCSRIGQRPASGTLAYMSPQQLMGKVGEIVDDVYSLGATLYDLLAGKPPFYTGDITEQIRTAAAPSMTERRLELGIDAAPIPLEWEQTIAACLSKDPERRPQSAGAVAKRLGARREAGGPLSETSRRIRAGATAGERGTAGAPGPTDGEGAPGAPVPAVWGKLEIRSRLGSGAFGDVYLARDPDLERDVALKLYKTAPSARSGDQAVTASRTATSERSDPSTPDRRVGIAAGKTPLRAAAAILREGRLMARLRHPNVALIYGADEHDGRIGIWMDYIRGQTLRELVQQQGRLGPNEAVLIGLDLCRALAAVHAAGLVHRDVKAGNVMREEGGRIVLMDFGVGIDQRASAHGLAETPSGTPLYMAPEVLLGGTTSPASDQYALGVLLFFLVTGSYPVTGDTLNELIAAHRSGRRQLLRDLRADLPKGFIDVVERTMIPDPRERFASMGEMERSLAAVVGAPSGAAAGTRTNDPIFRQVTFDGLARDGQISPDERNVAYACVEEDGTLAVRLQDMTGGESTLLYKSPGMIPWRFRWSPDGARLVARIYNEQTPTDGALYAIQATGGQLRRVFEGVGFFTLSPDGRRVAHAWQPWEGRYVIADLHTGQTDTFQIEGRGEWLMDLDWSSKGDKLLFLEQNKTTGCPKILIVPAGSTEILAEISDRFSEASIASPRWAPSGRSIYYLGKSDSNADVVVRRLDVNDLRGAQEAGSTALLSGLEPSNLSISRDGRGLLLTRSHDRSNLWALTPSDPEGSPVPQRLTKGNVSDLNPAISPDGTAVAFARSTGQSQIFRMPVAGGPAMQLTAMERGASCPVWSPDGQTIAFLAPVDGTVKVWTIPAAGGRPKVFMKTAGSRDIAWAPGERILYQRPGNQNFHLLDPATESETPVVRDESVGWIFGGQYAPGGREAVFMWNRRDVRSQTLWVVDLTTGADRKIVDMPRRLWAIGWTADGQWILAYSYAGVSPGRIYRIPAAGGEAEKLHDLPSPADQIPGNWTMSADGNLIIASILERQSDLWLVENFDPDRG